MDILNPMEGWFKEGIDSIVGKSEESTELEKFRQLLRKLDLAEYEERLVTNGISSLRHLESKSSEELEKLISERPIHARRLAAGASTPSPPKSKQAPNPAPVASNGEPPSRSRRTKPPKKKKATVNKIADFKDTAGHGSLAIPDKGGAAHSSSPPTDGPAATRLEEARSAANVLKEHLSLLKNPVLERAALAPLKAAVVAVVSTQRAAEHATEHAHDHGLEGSMKSVLAARSAVKAPTNGTGVSGSDNHDETKRAAAAVRAAQALQEVRVVATLKAIRAVAHEFKEHAARSRNRALHTYHFKEERKGFRGGGSAAATKTTALAVSLSSAAVHANAAPTLPASQIALLLSKLPGPECLGERCLYALTLIPHMAPHEAADVAAARPDFSRLAQEPGSPGFQGGSGNKSHPMPALKLDFTGVESSSSMAGLSVHTSFDVTGGGSGGLGHERSRKDHGFWRALDAARSSPRLAKAIADVCGCVGAAAQSKEALRCVRRSTLEVRSQLNYLAFQFLKTTAASGVGREGRGGGGAFARAIRSSLAVAGLAPAPLPPASPSDLTSVSFFDASPASPAAAASSSVRRRWSSSAEVKSSRRSFSARKRGGDGGGGKSSGSFDSVGGAVEAGLGVASMKRAHKLEGDEKERKARELKNHNCLLAVEFVFSAAAAAACHAEDVRVAVEVGEGCLATLLPLGGNSRSRSRLGGALEKASRTSTSMFSLREGSSSPSISSSSNSPNSSRQRKRGGDGTLLAELLHAALAKSALAASFESSEGARERERAGAVAEAAAVARMEGVGSSGPGAKQVSVAEGLESGREGWELKLNPQQLEVVDGRNGDDDGDEEEEDDAALVGATSGSSSVPDYRALVAASNTSEACLEDTSVDDELQVTSASGGSQLCLAAHLIRCSARVLGASSACSHDAKQAKAQMHKVVAKLQKLWTRQLPPLAASAKFVHAITNAFVSPWRAGDFLADDDDADDRSGEGGGTGGCGQRFLDPLGPAPSSSSFGGLTSGSHTSTLDDDGDDGGNNGELSRDRFVDAMFAHAGAHAAVGADTEATVAGAGSLRRVATLKRKKRTVVAKVTRVGTELEEQQRREQARGKAEALLLKIAASHRVTFVAVPAPAKSTSSAFARPLIGCSAQVRVNPNQCGVAVGPLVRSLASPRKRGGSIPEEEGLGGAAGSPSGGASNSRLFNRLSSSAKGVRLRGASASQESLLGRLVAVEVPKNAVPGKSVLMLTVPPSQRTFSAQNFRSRSGEFAGSGAPGVAGGEGNAWDDGMGGGTVLNAGGTCEDDENDEHAPVANALVEEVEMGGARSMPKHHDYVKRQTAKTFFNLGVIFNDGTGVKFDAGKAVEAWRVSAALGHSQAQNNLGIMLSSGDGVAKNDAASVAMYTLAADQGSVSAQYNLGVMLAKGRGHPKDEAGAVGRWLVAARRGHVGAHFNAAVMYEKGALGVAKDARLAVAHYSYAAERGHRDAQFNLGFLYEKGAEGLAPASGLAYMYYGKAAALGDEEAAFRLARLTH